MMNGLHRGVAGAASGSAGHLMVDVEEKPDVTPPRSRTMDLEREYRAVVMEILEHRGDDGRIAAFLRSITEPGALADTAGYSPDLTFAQKVELLQTLDVVERLTLALRLQRERLAELQVRKRIREDAESGAQKQQREYLLRRQLESIQKELGQDGESLAGEYRAKIEAAGMPGTSARRPSASSAGSSAWASRAPRRRRSAPTSTGCSRSRGRSAPRSASIPPMPGRSSTPTMRASTT
jgi:ATP-dependent Lon protease